MWMIKDPCFEKSTVASQGLDEQTEGIVNWIWNLNLGTLMSMEATYLTSSMLGQVSAPRTRLLQTPQWIPWTQNLVKFLAYLLRAFPTQCPILGFPILALPYSYLACFSWTSWRFWRRAMFSLGSVVYVQTCYSWWNLSLPITCYGKPLLTSQSGWGATQTNNCILLLNQCILLPRQCFSHYTGIALLHICTFY